MYNNYFTDDIIYKNYFTDFRQYILKENIIIIPPLFLIHIRCIFKIRKLVSLDASAIFVTDQGVATVLYAILAY